MEILIVLNTCLSLTFLWMHELDAIHHREWCMFDFMKAWKEETQYRVFLLMHIPLLLFTFYYLWTVFEGNSPILFIIVNLIFVAHAIVHTTAIRSKVNVFSSFLSFIFIYGCGICGLLNLVFVVVRG